MKFKSIATMGVFALVFTLGTVTWGAETDATVLDIPTKANETEVDETESSMETILIGEKNSDSDYEVRICNESGKEIKEIAIRNSYGDFSDNLLPETVTMKDHSDGILWWMPAEMVNYVPPVYDMKLTFTDDLTVVLHTLPFGDSDKITIREDEDTEIMYISFFSKSLNTESDSLTREKNVAENGEEGMIADYRARIESANSGNVNGIASAGGSQSTTPSNASNGNKQCLEDGLIF